MTIIDIILRLALALFVGGLIGYEREYYNRPAGFRTHILVCSGATIISLIQVQMVNEVINKVAMYPELASVLKADYGRLGAQVISGIGFLGAGTIIHQKGSIKGLTTAASLWNVACLGLAIGMGYYGIAIAGAIACVVVLLVLKSFHDKIFQNPESVKIEIKYKRKEEDAEYIEQFFTGNNIKIISVDHHGMDKTDGEGNIVTCEYTLLLPKQIDINKLMSKITIETDVLSVNLVQE